MRLLVCIDDTDTIDSELGTGRQSRRLATLLVEELPSLSLYGCVRQQLLVHPDVPYTTHNSCACMVFEAEDLLATDATDTTDAVEAVAGPYLREHTPEGSDPGLCIAPQSAVPEAVQRFGRRATEVVLDEREAWDLAEETGLFLDEYGGTGEGVVGALAGVGLTAAGETGRFVEFGAIREYQGTVPVETVREGGIEVVDEAGSAVTTGALDTHDWVRPQLRGGEPVLPVVEDGDVWVPSNL